MASLSETYLSIRVSIDEDLFIANDKRERREISN
jgi:hypothetical protein